MFYCNAMVITGRFIFITIIYNSPRDAAMAT